MPLFGSKLDISLFTHINNELLGRIIEQKIGYYKLSLNATPIDDVYGESDKKTYHNPVLINCMVTSDPQSTNHSITGLADVNRILGVAFYRKDLVDIQLVPERGDILLWNNDYYEISNIEENQYFMGKDPTYSYTNNTNDFGSSISIIVKAHYTRKEKLGIE